MLCWISGSASRLVSALTTPESALTALERMVGACLAALVASAMRLMICARPLPDSAACAAARASFVASSACFQVCMEKYVQADLYKLICIWTHQDIVPSSDKKESYATIRPQEYHGLCK